MWWLILVDWENRSAQKEGERDSAGTFGLEGVAAVAHHPADVQLALTSWTGLGPLASSFYFEWFFFGARRGAVRAQNGALRVNAAS